jgi:hypothetical protein
MGGQKMKTSIVILTHNQRGQRLYGRMVGPVSNYVPGPQQIRVDYRDLSGLDAFARNYAKHNQGRTDGWPFRMKVEEGEGCQPLACA